MFRRRRSADDFAEEIKSHLGLEADELKGEGLTEEEARRKAGVEFGNVHAAQEQFYLKNCVDGSRSLCVHERLDCFFIKNLPFKSKPSHATVARKKFDAELALKAG
jgi:hypothetical protein